MVLVLELVLVDFLIHVSLLTSSANQRRAV